MKYSKKKKPKQLTLFYTRETERWLHTIQYGLFGSFHIKLQLSKKHDQKRLSI